MKRQRRSELALVLGFLLVLAVVPITQTVLELRRGEGVQFMDVFRYRPTAKNLRQFENTLKEKSWFQETFRPAIQRLLFRTLGDAGAKGLPGRDRWVFYRPDVRYLVEPDRPEPDRGDSAWVSPAGGRTQRENVLRAIVRFRDQLQERGIELLVMPVPGKPSVYPDRLTRRVAGQESDFHSPTETLLQELQHRSVAAVDLFTVFREARSRRSGATNASALYLATDTHWTPAGAQLAAEHVAARLRELAWVSGGGYEFHLQPVRVKRWGDVLEMMQIPGAREAYGAEVVECLQVADPRLGLLVPTASDRPGTYRHPARKSTVLVLGDSFSRIYQYAEPQSLGELAGPPNEAMAKAMTRQGSKRLLPGSAGFVAHLARALQAPVDAIVSDGGASTDVRRKLSTDPEILEGKRVVVWEFVERDIALGSQGWEDVPLPRRLD